MGVARLSPTYTGLSSHVGGGGGGALTGDGTDS